jgi:hypothetical protein
MHNVFELVTKHWEEIFREIENRLSVNEMYKEANAGFNNLIDSLDLKTRGEISDYSNSMERIAQEAGYSQGFSDAVKLMTACLNQ